MRILHVINDLRIGGAERLLCDLVPRLCGDEFEVEVLALGRSDSFLQAQMVAGSAPLHLPAPALTLRSPKQVARLSQAMRDYDLVHVHLFPAQFWVAVAIGLVPRARRPLLATTEHNTYNRRRQAFFRGLDTWMYNRCDGIVAITKETSEALAAWVPTTRARTRVIENGVAIERFQDAPALDRALIGIPAGACLLCCVGRLEAQKDQATLIRALALLPEMVHAAFVGAGPLGEELERLAEASGVSDRVHFLGPRGDVPEILKTSDIYVQPSRWEGFGIAVVEAMAAGVPAVVSDVPGMREVAGDAGVTFPPGDAPALAAAIQTLIADPETRSALGARGQTRSAAFSIDRCVAEHKAFYRSLAADCLDRRKRQN